MKVKELIIMLEGVENQELQVVIPIVANCFGPSGCANIVDCYFGFDWDMGKLFLQLDKNLTVYKKGVE